MTPVNGVSRVLALLAGVGVTMAIAAPQPAATRPWVPPMGIPAPSFGISETAASTPAGWSGPQPGFYYVNAGAESATDFNNPFGSPRRPRATIPLRLPAGAVVELHGVYDHAHVDGRTIVAEGTAQQPVFIRGSSRSTPPAIVQPWYVSGQYLVLEHLKFRDRDTLTTGSLVVLAPAHYIVVRHSEVSGNRLWGGLGIESWDGTSSTSNIVIYGNKIHDNGDVAAAFDQDRHGIHVGVRAGYVWVVDNEMWRNSGDGIQINAGSAAAQATTHHIYVGRNTSHHNKQYGFWTKQAVDVIFSQNVAYAHYVSNSSMGAGLGFQYAPSYVWFLFNHIYDADYGIGTGSDSELGIGTESFFIGNVIHDIHDSNGDFNPMTGWQNCGISLPGGVNRYVVNNTMFDVDSGVCSPGVMGKIEIHNNLIFKIRRDGYHVLLEHGALAETSRGFGNVFGPTYRALTGGTQHEYATEERGGPGSNIVVRDAGFGGSPHWLRPRADSPAIDTGVNDPAGVYTIFEKRYGLDIRKDFQGNPRPVGPAYDAGAYEQPAEVTR